MMSGCALNTLSSPVCSSTTGEAPVLPVICSSLPFGDPLFLVSSSTTSRATFSPVSTKFVVNNATHFPSPGFPGRARHDNEGNSSLLCHLRYGCEGLVLNRRDDKQSRFARQQVLDIG